MGSISQVSVPTSIATQRVLSPLLSKFRRRLGGFGHVNSVFENRIFSMSNDKLQRKSKNKYFLIINMNVPKFQLGHCEHTNAIIFLAPSQYFLCLAPLPRAKENKKINIF